MLKAKLDVSAPSFLLRVNPLVKIGVSIAFTSIAITLHKPEVLGLLAIILLGLVLVWVGINWMILVYSAISLAIFVSVAMVFQSLSHPLVSILRIVTMLLPTPLLAGTTLPADLVRALQAVRLPNFLVLSLMLIWRFLPLMQQEMRRIFEANQLRGIELSRQPKYWFSGLLMPLIFRIVAYADDVTIGLETRGYDPDAPRSNYQPLKWQTIDTGFLTGSISLLGILSYLEWGK